MFFTLDFSIRLHTSEQLDNLSLSGKELLGALSSLKLINKTLGNHRQLANSVLKYCHAHPEKKAISIVDIGSGGGDTIHYIAKRLIKKGIKVLCVGIDGNPQSIAHANTKYANHTYLKFITADILDSNFVVPDCDIMISSHFIYHFKDDKLIEFLKKMQQNKIKHFIFSELKRSKIAYFLFNHLSYMMPISSIAKKDGLLAIRRAFTVRELTYILRKSNVRNFAIDEKLWFRTLTKIDL